MALIIDDNLAADGRVSARVYNKRKGSEDFYSCFLDGDFGGGTATVQVSLDGTNWVDYQNEAGNTVSFTADGFRNILLNSDSASPVYLG